MTYEPALPTIIRRPERIADETWLIHQVQEALGAPLRVYLNSMVIRGAEPVIVDTGTVANRAQWHPVGNPAGTRPSIQEVSCRAQS